MGGDGDEERDEEEVHSVGDQVMVSEFHVLELHCLKEIGEISSHFVLRHLS